MIFRIFFSLLSVFHFATIYSYADENKYVVADQWMVHEHHGGMPALCKAANGDILLAFATNWQPIPPAAGNVMLMRSSDNGRTWTKPSKVVFANDLNCSVHMWSGLHLMPDNSLILAYGQNYSEEIAQAYFIRSLDHGYTWSSPEELVDGSRYPFIEGFGQAVTTSYGDVLVPLGVRRSGGYSRDVISCFVRSQDSGYTWGDVEILAEGSHKFSETVLSLAANGDLIAIIRSNAKARILYQGRSPDNGYTWEISRAVAKNEGTLLGKMPSILSLPSGRMTLAVGAVGGKKGHQIYGEPYNTSYAGLYVSDDFGDSWKKDVMFTSPDPYRYIPYDAPVSVALDNGDILVVHCAYDREYKDHPLRGWTMGSHLVANLLIPMN